MLYLRRATCFVYLKNKYMARKCLREAKKQSIFHSGFEEDIRTIEEWINDMADEKRKKNDEKTRFESKAKCSNPTCENVEERSKQFQVCSKCRAVRYCSR